MGGQSVISADDFSSLQSSDIHAKNLSETTVIKASGKVCPAFAHILFRMFVAIKCITKWPLMFPAFVIEHPVGSIQRILFS